MANKYIQLVILIIGVFAFMFGGILLVFSPEFDKLISLYIETIKSLWIYLSMMIIGGLLMVLSCMME